MRVSRHNTKTEPPKGGEALRIAHLPPPCGSFARRRRAPTPHYLAKADRVTHKIDPTYMATVNPALNAVISGSNGLCHRAFARMRKHSRLSDFIAIFAIY